MTKCVCVGWGEFQGKENGHHCGGPLGGFEEVFTDQNRDMSLFQQPVALYWC